jgi:hypothetical protein
VRSPNVMVTAACVALTLILVATPELEFAVRAPRVVTASETASGAAAMLVAVLFLARFRARGTRADMLLCHGFAVFGTIELVAAILPDVLRIGPEAIGCAMWSRTWGGAAVTAGLLGAALSDPHRPTAIRPAIPQLVGRVLVISASIIGAVAALYQFAPGVAEGGAPSIDSATPVLADRAFVSGRLAAGALLLVAAWAFHRRWRRSGDELLFWLTTAAVLAGFARLHAFLYPVAGSQFVTTAHGFRLASSIVLAIAVVREILRHWQHHAARAVMEERRRIAQDLHTGMGNLAFITAQSRWLRSRGAVPEGALADLAEAAEEALAEARRAINDLKARPDDAGPEAAGAVAAARAAVAAAAEVAAEAASVAEVAAEVAVAAEVDAGRLEQRLVSTSKTPS